MALPQALGNMAPAIVNHCVALLKNTSLAFIIGVIEFFRAGTIVNGREHASFGVFTFIAAVYFACCFSVAVRPAAGPPTERDQGHDAGVSVRRVGRWRTPDEPYPIRYRHPASRLRPNQLVRRNPVRYVRDPRTRWERRNMADVALGSSCPFVYPAPSELVLASALRVCEADPASAPRPRLLDRVREAVRAKHYSRRTEKAYVHWIKRYIVFHGKRHPSEMGAAEVTAFLTSLAVRDKVAASTQNQALSALLFLYRVVLGTDLPWLDEVVRAKRPQYLPVEITLADTTDKGENV